MREKHIQSETMKTLSAAGATVFRNNVGVAEYKDGSRVAYGLCPGSSDVIGWWSKTITAADVGKHVAVFMAVECKQPGKKPTELQKRFLAAVRNAGGIALVVDNIDAVETARKAVLYG